jgi:hypothetical protein
MGRFEVIKIKAHFKLTMKQDIFVEMPLRLLSKDVRSIF